jgi:hypothetical protein
MHLSETHILLSAVVPAKAGTQYSSAFIILPERISGVSDYWVPAFAGTTER